MKLIFSLRPKQTNGRTTQQWARGDSKASLSFLETTLPDEDENRHEKRTDSFRNAKPSTMNPRHAKLFPNWEMCPHLSPHCITNTAVGNTKGRPFVVIVGGNKWSQVPECAM